jgi:GrpB-like predicted nucleotidyltransferase (UPF0157 family)
VGTPDRPATITVADYDPRWPAWYEREAVRIRAVLGDRVLRLEHVGSTSVPGLPAKPIIDILLVLPDTTDEATYVPAMEAAGYRLTIREPGWFEHRLFKGPDTNVNLHVFPSGAEEIDRMLIFRDWLRRTDADRDHYAAVKRDLARRTWRNVQDYTDSKSAVVGEIMARAGAGSAAGEGP